MFINQSIIVNLGLFFYFYLQFNTNKVYQSLLCTKVRMLTN